MYVPVPGWKVVCDEPGCLRETGDDSDYSFYSDTGPADDDWYDADGSRIDILGTREVAHYCHKHIPVCSFETDNNECDGVTYVHDGIFYCDDHVPLED